MIHAPWRAAGTSVLAAFLVACAAAVPVTPASLVALGDPVADVVLDDVGVRLRAHPDLQDNGSPVGRGEPAGEPRQALHAITARNHSGIATDFCCVASIHTVVAPPDA